MALAGLWEHWENQDDKKIIESCTILTIEATDLVATLHNRMPVILEPGDFERWLDPEEHNTKILRNLMHPVVPGILSMYPVVRYVNKAGNEGKECLKPSKVDK